MFTSRQSTGSETPELKRCGAEMLRKILIGFAILLLLLMGAGAFLYYKVQPGIREAKAQAEAKQKMLQPRLIEGEGKFERRAFYRGEGVGSISQITVGWPADREGADIAAVGNQGVDFVDWAGHVKKQVRFSIEQRCSVVVARIDPSGEYGYLTREESWAVPATLFDKEGHVAWRSSAALPGVDDSAPGNMHGDGRLSVVIGYNGDGGVALLDAQGKTLWKKEEGNVWHVEMLDTNEDGREEIIHSNAKGQLLVRNGDGNVVGQYLPSFYVSHFTLTRWGGETRPSHILVPISAFRDACCKSELILLDANGKELRELESPLGEFFNRMSATPIRFGKKADYFAVLKNDFSSERSMLLLYGEDGQIVYQEILGESCLGMTTLPTKDGERLLVGCAAKIWEYSPVFLKE
jgi:hypothetical protein